MPLHCKWPKSASVVCLSCTKWRAVGDVASCAVALYSLFSHKWVYTCFRVPSCTENGLWEACYFAADRSFATCSSLAYDEFQTLTGVGVLCLRIFMCILTAILTMIAVLDVVSLFISGFTITEDFANRIIRKIALPIHLFVELLLLASITTFVVSLYGTQKSLIDAHVAPWLLFLVFVYYLLLMCFVQPFDDQMSVSSPFSARIPPVAPGWGITSLPHIPSRRKRYIISRLFNDVHGDERNN